MPRKYIRRRRRNVKRSRRYAPRKGLRTVKRTIGGVLPDMLRLRMTYTQQGTLSSALVSFVENVFRGNSIFDPDQTGIGTQPMGRDQWANFYNSYRVYASKIIFSCDTEDGSDGIIFGCVPTNDPSPLGSTRNAMELIYSRHKNLGISAGVNAKTVQNYMETSKMKGVKAINYTTVYTANMSANPVAEWFWHVYVGSSDGVSFPNVNYTVKIIYYVELLDRVTLSTS